MHVRVCKGFDTICTALEIPFGDMDSAMALVSLTIEGPYSPPHLHDIAIPYGWLWTRIWKASPSYSDNVGNINTKIGIRNPALGCTEFYTAKWVHVHDKMLVRMGLVPEDALILSFGAGMVKTSVWKEQIISMPPQKDFAYTNNARPANTIPSCGFRQMTSLSTMVTSLILSNILA
jgi:hypothetical protein